MKRYKEMTRRFCTVLLALMLCISFMPAGAFANDEVPAEGTDTPAVELQDQVNEDAADVQDADAQAEEPAEADTDEPAENVQNTVDENEPMLTEEKLQSTDEGEATKDVTPEDDPEPVDPVDTVPAKTEFKLNGIPVQFNQKVVRKPDSASNIKPGRVWITGQKSSIKVSWNNASNMAPVEGVFIMRAKGTSTPKHFTQVKKLSFRTDYDDGTYDIDPKTTWTDTGAKTKNTAYTYRVVSYYVKDGYTYISPISDWAAGQTTASKLKNVTKASMNKKTVKLQSKGTVQLSVKIDSPSTKFMPKSRRWSSSNEDVAKISSGKVTAKAPGSATIRCRLASGKVVTSTITVVGALKPAAPTLKIDYATKEKIVLVWNKVKNATSYKVYRSNDGLHWASDPIKTTTGTTVADTNVTANHRYTYYVIAVNKNTGLDKDGKSKTYTAESTNSNVINQKAVVRLRPTKVTGFPTKKSLTAGSTLKVKVKVTYPESRKAYLQMKSGKKWVTKKTISLPKGKDTASVTITFPNNWWDGKTEWRLNIPQNKNAKAFTTDTLTITATRRYQNPSTMVQIKNSISKHGYSHYVAPVLVNSSSTRTDHVNALIKTAKKYLGNKYVQSKSGAPGKGIDESGLIMQACYGAGVDLWPISPSTRPYNCIPKIMSSKLQKVSIPATPPEGSNDYVGVYAGDLIFFSDTKNGTPIHAAIYTGLGGLIHADPIKGNVNTSTIRKLVDRDGSYKYYIVGVRRVFHF